VEGGATRLVAQLDGNRCAGRREQHRKHVAVTARRREVDGCAPGSIGMLDVRLGLQERGRNRRVSLARSVGERTPAGAGRGINVNASQEQHLDYLGATGRSRNVQRRPVAIVFGIEVRGRLKEAPHQLGVVSDRRVVQRRPAVGVLGQRALHGRWDGLSSWKPPIAAVELATTGQPAVNSSIVYTT